MAGDWIKMRVWLARDPRTIRMADYLAEQRPFMNWLTDPVQQTCKESAYEHVTRNVIVSLCVTGLLVTWGTAREQGDRVDDDLVLAHCDKYTFDAITDIECFGEAMEHVGWLVDVNDGSVTFPKFFKDNESPDEKHKRQNAERQARFREKQSRDANDKVTETNNVTVTHREEKRREELKPSSPDKPDDGFPEFWKAYPRKVGKGAALKAWGKIKSKSATLQAILNALAWQRTADQWTKDGGQFIPHPSTWLNEQRWLDESPAKAAAPIPFDRDAYEAKRKAQLAADREAYKRDQDAATVPVARAAP